MANKQETLFSVQVRTGDKKAWRKVKQAIKGTGTVTRAAEELAVSRRTLTYWLAEIDGLSEFVGER